MNLEELKNKYSNVPNDLKVLKRWVGFKVEKGEDGKTAKRPYNPLTGVWAKVNDDLTWSTFNIALSGCVKYNFDGIGFILGNGIFGVDLDNHPDKDGHYAMTDDEFQELVDEFVNALDSYSELSQSKKGVHIICSGALPEGARRKKDVPIEMYDCGRFFAFTGYTIHNTPINNREKEIVPLWEKYLYTPRSEIGPSFSVADNCKLDMSDEEVIRKALESKSGEMFYKYYHDGDLSQNGGDHSSADVSFCNMLAFWCNRDKAQMDRIFRNSALMRDKWDEYRGGQTYGEITINASCSMVANGYVKIKQTANFTIKNTAEPKFDENGEVIEDSDDYSKPVMNIDENGEPIFRIKKIYKRYSYNDTGNAERFYDYFGDLFKYNVTDKIFMFWTGKVWLRDSKDIIRKYANKFLEILKEEEKIIAEEIEELRKQGKKDQVIDKVKILEACQKNAARVANKAGKDAMLSELRSLYDIPVESNEFNKDDYLLNTQSGVVDLKTGKISNFNKNLYLSKITTCEVSYEEPKVWLKFLWSVFYNGNDKETQEMIDSLQTCIGYSLSGLTIEQVMFLLYGGGSNGKSTMVEEISYAIGDYGDNIQSSILMQQKTANNSANFSFAKLQNVRFVATGETDDGNKLAEAQIKLITGGDTIAAQYKFGNEFSYKPKFKIWMSTNNKPIIRGTDFGIWRRLFLFPFMNIFDGDKKDKNLPEKLRRESDKILGWCIKGFLKYQELGDLIRPKAIKSAIEEYKEQMDIVSQFVNKQCDLSDNYQTDCKVLYTHYKEWAQDNTEFTMKESKFSEELKKKGITISQSNNGRPIYIGIKIKGAVNIKDTTI